MEAELIKEWFALLKHFCTEQFVLQQCATPHFVSGTQGTGVICYITVSFGFTVYRYHLPAQQFSPSVMRHAYVI